MQITLAPPPSESEIRQAIRDLYAMHKRGPAKFAGRFARWNTFVGALQGSHNIGLQATTGAAVIFSAGSEDRDDAGRRQKWTFAELPDAATAYAAIATYFDRLGEAYAEQVRQRKAWLAEFYRDHGVTELIEKYCT